MTFEHFGKWVRGKFHFYDKSLGSRPSNPLRPGGGWDYPRGMNTLWKLAILVLLWGSFGLAREAILYECIPSHIRVKSLVFAGPDNLQLDGVLMGEGSTVVLSNQSDNISCRWMGFARTLASNGFSVLFYSVLHKN